MRPTAARPLTTALLTAILLALGGALLMAPVATAIPDADDVKDEVEEKKEEAEEEAEEQKEEAEEEAEEAEGRGRGDSRRGRRRGAGRHPRPGDAGDSRRADHDRGEGRRLERRCRTGRAASPAAAAPRRAPGEDRVRAAGGGSSGGSDSSDAPDGPLSVDAAREASAGLLGAGAAGPVRRVPRSTLTRRPSARQSARLRRRLAQYDDCLGGGLQARALRLRAGRRSWVQVGRRLGMSSRRALALGRMGLARLNSLSGSCGVSGAAGPSPAVPGPVAFSQRFGAAGVGSSSMLGMALPQGDAPTALAGEPGGAGDVLGATSGRSAAPLGPGQSSYVGPPPALPGEEQTLETATPTALAAGGDGQGTAMGQVIALLGLALVTLLALRYRLRAVEAPAGNGAVAGVASARNGSAANGGATAPTRHATNGGGNGGAEGRGSGQVVTAAAPSRASAAEEPLDMTQTPEHAAPSARSPDSAEAPSAPGPWHERPRARRVKRLLSRSRSNGS